MALHVALTHRTEYVYDRLTALGPQIVRLRPAPAGGAASIMIRLTSG